ncbi:MAG: cysteine hydrolase [Bacteroidales bacterium]|nr:cysteine hydrolase [Bacteroidales bacterium]MCF8344243.1 cysteine hydrolase [Bacteroidales bacterium]MCF8350707.1 cysteine hydrolase [Bacteroidales bacterium]MCF8377518.1 cysteine hydrolase [Bacteroidales bacterium]MCF8401815.1 cysteine hydrolase [Bacteroidales bacterium]
MKKITITLALLIVSAVTGMGQESKKELKPALLVIDVQNRFIPLMSEEDQNVAIAMINWSIGIFRQYDLPVIRIHHTTPGHGPEPGTDEFAFDNRIKTTENDPMITKTYGSAFNKTELDSLLQAEGINTLYMCGLSSVGCVLATYMDANNYDYKAFLIKDALLSHDASYTEDIEKIFGAIDLNTVDFMLEMGKGIKVTE